MKYSEYINQVIRQEVSAHQQVVLLGQNIAAGSCISGFTRGLKLEAPNRVINTPNCENTLCGVGFGAMINGISAVFFMKQLDFLLLGIDQLVNTHNIISRQKPKGSFTIMPVVVDSGYEGPQSCLNNLNDFCSIARIQGFTINTKTEADVIIGRHMFSPGFRIIAVSQRLFKTEILEDVPLKISSDRSVFQYAAGQDATVVCFNFSLTNGKKLVEDLKTKGIVASLFSVSAALPVAWEDIIQDIVKTKQVVIIDDSKSVNSPAHQLIIIAQQLVNPKSVLLFSRGGRDIALKPNPDEFIIDHEDVCVKLGFAVK